MRNLAIIAVMLTALSCHSLLGPKKFEPKDETAIVEADVRAMSDALFAGDTQVLVGYLYPTVLEKYGGPEAFTRLYNAIIASQTKAGIKRLSLTFPTAPEFIEGKDGRWFVLMSSRTEVESSNGSRGALTGVHLGVKQPNEDEWKYIPGLYVRPDLLPALVPDFPADHPLPPRGAERLS